MGEMSRKEKEFGVETKARDQYTLAGVCCHTVPGGTLREQTVPLCPLTAHRLVQCGPDSVKFTVARLALRTGTSRRSLQTHIILVIVLDSIVSIAPVSIRCPFRASPASL